MSPGIYKHYIQQFVGKMIKAFDNMSEESEKTTFFAKKSLRPVPSQGMVESAKKHGGFRPQQSYLGYALRPHRKR